MQIYAMLKSEDVTQSAEMAALFMREHIKRNIRNKIVGERVRNAMRPKLAVQPTSWQAHSGMRTSVPDAEQFRHKAMNPELGFKQMDGKPHTEEN
jgi:predicted RNA-binding Zn ribbon-like protein